MSVVIYEMDATPSGIIKRLERKNNKYQLARVIQETDSICHDEKLSDAEKIKKIKTLTLMSM